MEQVSNIASAGPALTMDGEANIDISNEGLSDQSPVLLAD